ncbi:Transcriptional regulator, contains XRE-family HTH domain [Butyrivibrio hungatei DSM 14810]|uniref:Transcriptional regulator, contains XRE-family HTH domain n=1 Tax=Butyrivibrio hungatei DSM 14810 TaxID=1121132 RepID=A0A1M7T1E3_9FIRM|nr:helix-turn-helix transcriptional regulator [Butyrivibrio hungatei]SHN64519.1 Transcriptional regulator, contains XRE-family HTH domain [Butyrivibrio hungatei DSM 14810]
MDSNTMGERIRTMLYEKGMTQKDLATAAGITEAAVSLYIKGDRVPRSTVLSKIAIALNTTPEYLIEGIPNDVKGELGYARRLIARNVEQMTKSEKMELINILMGADDDQ